MKKLLLILMFVPLVSFGQTKEELQLCLAVQTNSFSTDTEADDALDRILNVIGASKNFVLTPCSEINNVIATSYKGIRYILYDKAFMRTINSRTNDWSSLTILAHEVGHHINGHALDLTMYAGGVVEAKSLAAKRKMELEADEFSAFIMAKLGAPLNKIESAISLISNDKDDSYSTHPAKSKRLNAVRIGFNKAGVNANQNNDYVTDNSNMEIEQYSNIVFNKAGVNANQNNDYVTDNSNMTIEQYFNRGIQKKDSEDYYGAIEDFNEVLNIKSDYATAYYWRGNSKYFLKDNYGAIADFTKAIELNPDYADAYNHRGISRTILGDDNGAIADYTKAIELNPDFATAYQNRGVAKRRLGDKNGSCADYRIAASLGKQNLVQWVREKCN